MDDKNGLSITVNQLRAAGTDLSKQIPPLLELGEWYLKKAKTTQNYTDFTKASALYNAALVRSRRANNKTDDNQIFQQIIETYREFVHVFVTIDDQDDEFYEDEIGYEIDSHKEFLANERRIFEERANEIDSCFNTSDKTEDQYQVRK